MFRKGDKLTVECVVQYDTFADEKFISVTLDDGYGTHHVPITAIKSHVGKIEVGDRVEINRGDFSLETALVRFIEEGLYATVRLPCGTPALVPLRDLTRIDDEKATAPGVAADLC